MLSNISQVQMNTAYPPTHINLQQYMHSTISQIITVKRHKQKQNSLPHQNATNLQSSEPPTGVVSLVMRLKKALLSNCSNLALSPVLSYASLVDQLHRNQPIKIKQPSVAMKPKSLPPMSAPPNSNP